jgi:pilus assembly protein Flp/PilA
LSCVARPRIGGRFCLTGFDFIVRAIPLALYPDPKETVMNAFRRFLTNEDGAALAEYGILVAFIAIVAITAVTFFGSKISTKFSSIANNFS